MAVVQAQMWVMNVDHRELLVWTQGNKLLTEKITIDRDFVATWLNTITLFSKAYIVAANS